MDGPSAVQTLKDMVSDAFDLDLNEDEIEAIKFAIGTIESIIEAHEVNSEEKK